MTEEEIQEKILKCLESEIVNILLTDHLITDQQRSDFDAVHRKMFLPKTIASLKGKTEKTRDEEMQLFALENTPRTEFQQLIYVKMLRAFIDGQVNWLQGKAQRSTTENRVLDALTAVEKTSHFRTPIRTWWCFKEQYRIRFGNAGIGFADIALLLNRKPFVIVECKKPKVSRAVIRKGKEQLESYLNASRANLGILANSDDPQKWTYYDNSIGFDKIDRATFWKKIKTAFTTERDIEKEAQQLKQQRIEERAKELAAQATGDIDARAKKMIDEAAKKRVTPNAVYNAIVRQLQREKNQLESQRQQEKRQLEVQLQNETDQLESTIGDLEKELAKSRSRATWGWALFGISVVIIFIIAVNI